MPPIRRRRSTSRGRASIVEPYGPAVRVELARALAATGRLEEAVSEAEYAAELDPANAGASLLLAELYQQTGDLEKALAALKRTEAVKSGQTGVAEEIRRIETSLSAR